MEKKICNYCESKGNYFPLFLLAAALTSAIVAGINIVCLLLNVPNAAACVFALGWFPAVATLGISLLIAVFVYMLHDLNETLGWETLRETIGLSCALAFGMHTVFILLSVLSTELFHLK